MSVFTIETPSGHQLQIEAPNQETALIGAQQWHADQQPSGIGANFLQGTSDVLSGGGKTLEALTGKGPVGTWLQDEGKKIAPANFVPAPIIDSSGRFYASGILPSVARAAPITAATILGGMAGAALAPEAVPAALAAGVGGAGVGMATSLGNEAQTAADRRTGVPNSPITNPDLAKGLVPSAAESAVGALPVTRYLAKLAPTAAATGTGLTGAATALKNYGKTIVAQAAASGASTGVGEAARGDAIDPTQIANAAATGAATGGLFGAKNAIRETLNASKYSAITPELQPAAAQFAQLAQKYADGRNLDAGFITGTKAQRTGEEVYNKANAFAQDNLKAAVDQLQNPLPRDAQNVVNAIGKGAQPHAGDYAVLQSALANDPQATNVLNAARVAHVGNIVGETGQHSGGKFTGGIASRVGGMLTGHNVTKTALVAAGGAALEGGAGHLIAYSPEVMGGVAAASALGRLADHLTGARAPMGRFVSNFAPASGSPAPQFTQPQQQPQPAPAAPAFGGPPVAGGSMLTPQIQAQMAARANLAKLAPAAPAAPAPIDPLALPTSITTPAKNLMGGIQKTAAARAAYEGALAAKDAVANSPFIEQKVGGAENVPAPAAAKEMSKAVSAANVLAKLQSDPAAEAEEKAAAKAEAAQMKAQAKAATISAKAVAKAAPPAPIPTPAEPPKITAVTKTSGKIGTEHTADEYVVPTSPYGHMAPAPAAKAITEAAMKSTQPPFKPEKFQAATQKNLEAIWDRARAIASEAPGVDPKAIYSQFAGVATKAQAIQHRNWLMKHMPQAAASIKKFFTDADINGTALQRGMWNK